MFLEHIDHVGERLISEYRDRLLNPRLHQYVVFSPLSYEMSSRWEHPREACLFSAISSLEEASLRNRRFFNIK